VADIFNMTDTWNDGATTFTAIKMNVTDTASASDSLLMDVQVGGTSLMQLNKFGSLILGDDSFGGNALTYGANGRLFVRNSYNAGGALFFAGSIFVTSHEPCVIIGGGHPLVFTNGSAGANSTQGTRLQIDGTDHVLGQFYKANAQTFNIYNTRTDASNYERLKIGWDTNVMEIKPEAAGTGTVRELHISGLPTSNPGAGILWNDAGTVKVGT